VRRDAKIPGIVSGIAILGAGELGGTLARRVAALQLARRVVLVDADEGRARGKALDIQQSGPVDSFDTRVEGAADLAAAGDLGTIVVADPPELLDADLTPMRSVQLAKALAPSLRGRGVVVAGVGGALLVEALVRNGLSREKVLGSAPVASCGALQRRLAAELAVEPSAVGVSLLGRPPDHLLVPASSATVGGFPVDGAWPVAVRRATGALRDRAPGPVALASAAARVLRALAGPRSSVLTVIAMLNGEYGHRGVALAVPARLRSGRLESVVEHPLEPIDRVALDTAAQRGHDQAWT
jgi:malate dehydrogenase